MEFKQTHIGVQPEIRKRVTDGDWTVPVTLDFTSVEADAEGKKVVKAGSPISAAGVVANDDTAKGILLTDVYAERPIGTILTHGFVNTDVANKNAGLTIAEAVKTKLAMISFE